MSEELLYWLAGDLRWSDFPPKADMIATIAASIVVAGAVGVVATLTIKRRWRWLFDNWLSSLDHKKIGIMYMVLAFVMLLRAVIEAVLMRIQQALSVNAQGVVSADHFAQLFSTHGTIMIFFVAMPFISGLINYVMPLQIGARDLTFPFMNAVGLWLSAAGAAILMASLVIEAGGSGGGLIPEKKKVDCA